MALAKGQRGLEDKMARAFGRRFRNYRGGRPRRSRMTGCLLWVIALLVLLFILSVLFGGFHKGTKADSSAPLTVTGRAPASLTVAASGAS